MEWRRGPSQARGDENVTVTNRPFVHAELAAAAGRGVGAAKRARHGRICIARPWNRNSECNRPADQNSEQVTDRLSTDTCCNARNQASLWRNVTRCSFAAARGSTSPTSSSRAELPTAMRLASMPIRGALSAVSGAEPGLNKPGRVAVTVMSGQRIDPGRQLEQRTVNPVEATQALSPDRLCHNLLRHCDGLPEDSRGAGELGRGLAQRHLMPHPIDGRWSGSTGRPASTASTAARTSAAVTGRSFRGRESSSWPR